MSIKEYCQSKQLRVSAASEVEILHQQFIEEIVAFLPTLIKEPFSVFREVILEKNKLFAGAVDIIALTPFDLYIFEGKVLTSRNIHNIDRKRTNIREQLRKSRDYFKNNFGVKSKCAGLYKELSTNKIYNVTKRGKEEFSFSSSSNIDRIFIYDF